LTSIALLAAAVPIAPACAASPNVAVGPQYDTTHVYVAAADFDRFVQSFVATFGGKAMTSSEVTITPTPSVTRFQAVLTPAGNLSVFGFKTPIPYPFGAERTGYLVADMDTAVAAARANGADVIVQPFTDPIGRDAIIQWPGGANMQLYWHTKPSTSAPLQTIPENRVYVSPDRADAFIRGFVAFAHGVVASDEPDAPGIEIGRPKASYRRVEINSAFGKLTVLVSDGRLPWPYGREITGYEVGDLAGALMKASASGASVLVGPYQSGGRRAAIVEFPGGYIAEIHALGVK
jgi:predicted enzyme related to lactoylglutathione lyase